MRSSFFYKEVVPPNLVRRNYLLKKLSRLKKIKSPSEPMKALIKAFRAELKMTEGKTLYYRCNKGVKMPIGDDTTSKKAFLVSKDPRFLEVLMKKHRAKLKEPAQRVEKWYHNKSTDYGSRYYTIGGVMEKPDFFNSELRKVKKKKSLIAKKPKRDDINQYIGIELEYASNLTIDQISEKIADHNLQDCVRVMRDGSIRVSDIYPHQVEFCILTKWSDLSETLNRLKPIIFDRPQNFNPNTSCGLHVHLDVRNDDPKRVYRNLASMQTVLFNIVAEHRRGNDYCTPLTTTDFDEADEESNTAHYDAISKASYYKHSTIEVRIHHSVLSLTRIEKWITLLKRIADYKGDGMELGTSESEFSILKEKVKIEPELMQYIQENMQS